MKKPILITGCPRSGTRYITSVMQQVFDILIGHETELGWGISDWKFVDPRFDKKPFRVVFHQIRFPLDVIASLHTISVQSQLFMERNIVPGKDGESVLIKCMKDWYYWNDEAERMATYSYRLENLEEELPRIGEIIEIEPDMDAFRRMPRSEHTRKKNPKYPILTWDDIEKENEKLYNDILEMAYRYGY